MFTQDQINELTSNKYVSKCSSKSIAYKKEFKVEAVKKYYDNGYSSRMIFEEAGFDLDVVGKQRAKNCLSRWKKIYARKGEDGLMTDGRGKLGGRPKTRYKDKQEEVKYLKTKIAYLEAENDFLAKLRGLKRE